MPNINSQYDYWNQFPEKKPADSSSPQTEKPADAAKPEGTEEPAVKEDKTPEEKTSIFLQEQGFVDENGEKIEDAKVNTISFTNEYAKAMSYEDDEVIAELNSQMLQIAGSDNDYTNISWQDLEYAATYMSDAQIEEEIGDDNPEKPATDETDEAETEADVAGVRRAQYQGAAADRIQTDENGQDFIQSGVWGSGDETFTSTSAILQNVYGVSYGSEEGNAVLKKLHEANPEFFASGDYNLIPANTRLNLIDASDILPPKEEPEATEEAQPEEAAEAEDAPAVDEADEAEDAPAVDEDAETEDVPEEEITEADEAPEAQEATDEAEIGNDAGHGTLEDWKYQQQQAETAFNGIGDLKRDDYAKLEAMQGASGGNVVTGSDGQLVIEDAQPESDRSDDPQAAPEEPRFNGIGDLKRDDYAKLAAGAGAVDSDDASPVVYNEPKDIPQEIPVYNQDAVANLESAQPDLVSNEKYQQLKHAAKDGLSPDGAELRTSDQQKAQVELNKFLDQFDKIGKLYTNRDYSDYFAYTDTDLSKDFIQFFNENDGDVDKAIAQYNTYKTEFVDPLIELSTTAVRNEKVLAGIEPNTWQDMIYKTTDQYMNYRHLSHEENISFFRSSAENGMLQYTIHNSYWVDKDGNPQQGITQRKTELDNRIKFQQDAINATDPDKNTNLSGFSSDTQAQVRELLEAYNKKLADTNGDWGTHSIMKNSEYQLRNQVEEAIKYYMLGHGSGANINLENLIHDLQR